MPGLSTQFLPVYKEKYALLSNTIPMKNCSKSNQFNFVGGTVFNKQSFSIGKKGWDLEIIHRRFWA
jgi:hypothetical protein